VVNAKAGARGSSNGIIFRSSNVYSISNTNICCITNDIKIKIKIKRGNNHEGNNYHSKFFNEENIKAV
jgi:hypothetical protein